MPRARRSSRSACDPRPRSVLSARELTRDSPPPACMPSPAPRPGADMPDGFEPAALNEPEAFFAWRPQSAWPQPHPAFDGVAPAVPDAQAWLQ